MTSAQMPTVYNAADVEQRIYEDWQSKGYFSAKIDKGKEPYVIIMPPPNVTGELHLGHALEKAIEDALYKASFYEKRLEIKLGDIIHFQALSGPSVSQNDKSMPMMRMAAEAMPSASIYAGDSEIITEIYLGFKID